MVTKQRGSSGEGGTLREGFRAFRSTVLLMLDVSRVEIVYKYIEKEELALKSVDSDSLICGHICINV